MGKATGFLEYERRESQAIDAKERIKNFNEFSFSLLNNHVLKVSPQK